MGRWAQRRIKGGGGVAGGPSPTLFISDVVWQNNNLVRATFNEPAVVDELAAMGGFTVDGLPATSVTIVDAITVDIGFSEQVDDGDPWLLSSQPPWLLTLAIVPESGTVVT